MTLRLNNQQNNSANIDYADQVGGANSTITIPQGDGTVAMVGANGGLAGNISAATIFRLDDNFNTDGAVITGWVAPAGAGESAGVGGAVTEASGVFTFPVTGIWLVLLSARILAADNDAQTNINMQFTTNAADFVTRATISGGNSGGGDNAFNSSSGLAIFDITDTANRQVRLRTASLGAGSNIMGGSDLNETAILFLRLGDT